MNDTIFALSSGFLPSSVAVIRLSGPMVKEVIRSMCGCLPSPRFAAYHALKAKNAEILDKGLVLFFPSPKSFTGEDVAEIHIHGSKAVLKRLLLELSDWPSLRHAEAGEFTKRAFLNGKFDLTEVEALSDLISAQTETQRRLALKNFDGEQAKIYINWRERIIKARALLETELDFSEEQEIPFSLSRSVWDDIDSLLDEISNHIEGFKKAEIIRDGYDVVLVGAPNAGKSSLINCMAGRDVAIVSNEPGTTRDLIEIRLDLNGIEVIVVDTAGVRSSTGYVENLGIERCKKRAEKADLVIEIQDLSLKEPAPSLGFHSDLIVGSKLDLFVDDSSLGYDFCFSSRTGEGVSQLLNEIEKRALNKIGQMENLFPLQLRHVDLLLEGKELLAQAFIEEEPELKAELLRGATNALERILGRVDVEDVLDLIFSRFCIGK